MIRLRNGFSVIIGATVVAGIVGYVVTLLVYRGVGPSDYALYAVFWGALYLIIGALSGLQQEVTRATREIEPGTRAHASPARNFAVVMGLVVLLVIVGTAPLWVGSVFRDVGWPLVFPLAVAAASYALVAVLAGSLFGLSRWGSLAFMIVVDPILRLALLGIGLLFTDDLVVLAWLTALPFPLSIVILWAVIRGGFVGRTDLDVGPKALLWNSARTVLAATATGVLVSGFPLLLGLVSHSQSPELVGELIFTITLTRAPLIVTVMSLQSYFVVRFRERANQASHLLFTVVGIVVAATVVLAALGWWLGPAVFEWVSGRPVMLDGGLIAILVVSSGLVAVLCATAAAVLARSQHFVYSTGWVVAALVTIVVLVLPMDFLPRVALALLVGPAAGLVVHVTWLVTHRHSTAVELEGEIAR